jgi:hypothetical protein
MHSYWPNINEVESQKKLKENCFLNRNFQSIFLFLFLFFLDYTKTDESFLRVK